MKRQVVVRAAIAVELDSKSIEKTHLVSDHRPLATQRRFGAGISSASLLPGDSSLPVDQAERLRLILVNVVGMMNVGEQPQSQHSLRES